jgi:Holliday junction resolvase
MNNNNERIEIINDMLYIKGQINNEWTVMQYADGEVCIECEHRDGNDALYLNQTELKQLIEFLQTKLK